MTWLASTVDPRETPSAVASRRLRAARLVFRAGVDADLIVRGSKAADVADAVLAPLRQEDPYVLEALRLDWGSRASVQLALAKGGLLEGLASRSLLGRTVAFAVGPIHGPLHRPSQPAPLPEALESLPFAFAAQQAYVRYLHAVVYPNPVQLGEELPARAAVCFASHLANWPPAAEVLAYDEVSRDAYAWAFAGHPAALDQLKRASGDLPAVVMQSPVLRTRRHWELDD